MALDIDREETTTTFRRSRSAPISNAMPIAIANANAECVGLPFRLMAPARRNTTLNVYFVSRAEVTRVNQFSLLPPSHFECASYQELCLTFAVDFGSHLHFLSRNKRFQSTRVKA